MDELSSALLKDLDLRVIVVTCTQAAREAARRHKAARAAAGVLAQGLTASLLIGALQKEDTRINVQVECDGPVRGMFLDADNEGNVRGYVKHPFADVEVSSAEYRFRPILGNKGYISVLRDLGKGEHYRSAVELEAFELSADFERYFQSSDQVSSVVRLDVLGTPEEPLAHVAGVLVQTLPSGTQASLEEVRARLTRQFVPALRAQPEESAHALLKTLFDGPDVEMMARYPVQFKCRCSRERVLSALVTVGKPELEDMLATDKKASVTCEFCDETYNVSESELAELLRKVQVDGTRPPLSKP